MAKNLKLKNAEKIREMQTAKSYKEIENFYVQLSRDISVRISELGGNNIKKQQLIILQRDIKQRLKNIESLLKQNVEGAIFTTANVVVEDTRDILKRMGFEEKDIANAFYYVPENVLNNIKTGAIYNKKNFLSNAIWGYSKHNNDVINTIIAHGTAQGKSAYEIAKDIERYVMPEAKRPSKLINSWRYDKEGKKIKDKFYFGKVDYNAQRLARTAISHAYQQSFEQTNANDPFVSGYKWLISNFHGRVCDICKDRAYTDKYGLGEGVFPKDELPLDHANGMCTFEAVIKKSMNDIAKDIGKWYNSPIGTYPDIDKFAESFLYY